MMDHGLLLYAGLWLSFALGHSAFASVGGRRVLERLAGRGDRLLYNVIAILHLALVLIGGWIELGGRPGFAFPWPFNILRAAAVLAGIAILLIAGRSYDPARFFGFAQLRAGAPERVLPAEALVTGGLNGRVRHPLYLGLLLLVWGDVHAPLTLATALFATAYVLVGIHFEERKLRRLYGATYDAYRAAVPMLIPRLAGRRGTGK
ncbi:methyltransferase family protein [Acidibrevibacterium fodinaquatile]|jgi:protein-S-isoprenylcysteine O-methyltransferase Ste14|uniref:methyltransferase family protein n=1 Tax=Acidibrevibacterium fodinaquatile TaxID=1969806 RepID=UPI001F0760F1|nr:isoprenylcysteine carboxylmethyltransferase family protein [Acidibrevibacterium fodinaquatile]